MFEPNSRYVDIETTTLVDADGEKIAFIRRRFVPQAADLAVVGQVTVRQGDRLDLLAGQQLGDPELFWRIADANTAMDPLALTEVPGRKLAIAVGGIVDSGGGTP
jgi:nucleoid-associated protein YgaU